MPHVHPVVDSDSRFVIDSTTREITTSSSKSELIQGDHQSERITFEISKLVEGHDMSLCDRIEIHYINTDKKTKATSKDVYIADDVTVDGDKLTFTWLISSNATKYQGSLNFIIIFMCLDDEGNYTYKWSTEICKLLTVGASIYNSGHVVNNYSDVLETFRREVIDEATEGVVKYTEQELTDDEKARARENIEVQGTYFGWKPCKYIFTSSGSVHRTFYMAEGEIKQLDLDTASDDIKNAWIQLYRIAILSPLYGLGRDADSIHSSLNKFWMLYNNGVFGKTLVDEGYRRITFGDFQDSNGRIRLLNNVQIFLRKDYIAVTSYREDNGVYSAGRMTPSKDEMDLWEVHDYYLQVKASQSNGDLTLGQIEMSTAPTKDMHIATKKYVDDKTITPASDDSLELLVETGFVTPAHQDGAIYTASTGEIYVI